jgi:hypothetical protein
MTSKIESFLCFYFYYIFIIFFVICHGFHVLVFLPSLRRTVGFPLAYETFGCQAYRPALCSGQQMFLSKKVCILGDKPQAKVSCDSGHSGPHSHLWDIVQTHLAIE